MNEIPRTFCITLRETPFRTKGFLEEASKHNLKAELFYGAFGKKLGLVPKYPNVIETSDDSAFITPGNIGCILSHYILWNILSYQPEDEFFIVEDDATFSDNFVEDFKDRYSRLPSDWQMVYVGWIPYGGDTTPSEVDHGISIRFPCATHAYLIKKSIIPQLCDALLPIKSPIDLTLIHHLLPNIKYYVFDPPLVDQKSFFNTNNPEWASILYDWKNDFYGLRKKLVRQLSFGSGWYALEKNIDESWVWSEMDFVINIPDVVHSIKLGFTLTKNNTLKFIDDNGNQAIEANEGYNEMIIPCQKVKSLTINIVIPFVPCKEEENNNDSRTLGICLKKVDLIVGGNEVNVPLQDI